METILQSINLAVFISTVAAFLLGWLWYSDYLFLKIWKKGIGEPAVKSKSNMWFGMITQLFSTLFLAIIINIFINNIAILILIVFTILGFIKASGFYCGKTKMAISVEVLYILTSAILIYVIQIIF